MNVGTEMSREVLMELVNKTRKERAWLASSMAKKECQDFRNCHLDVTNPKFTRSFWIEQAVKAAATWEEV